MPAIASPAESSNRARSRKPDAGFRKDPAAAGSMRALDDVALELGEGHEGDRPAVVDVGALDGDLAAGGDVLDHLEDVLRPRRPDRDDHDAAALELLQQGGRNMVDAAGDDDLVERGGVLPAVIAVRVLGVDRLVFGVAALDQRVVEAARALGQRLDDLDRPYLVGEVREIGRLIAGAGADLEHLLAHLDVDGAGHAPHHARPGDGHAETDIVVVDVVDDSAGFRPAELLARRHQEGALVARLPQVDVADHVLKAVEAGAQVARSLPAVP